ncbi:MAG: acetate kinase [Synechococcaceae bacterium WB9_2_112]|nr:acetate kinase [Synechococcaceae bacterium WB9_2_112]
MPPCVLVLNAGSSSIKAAVLATTGTPAGSTGEELTLLWSGHRTWSPQVDDPRQLAEAVEAALRPWLPEAVAVWRDRLELVGHRVVHGGLHFAAPTLVTAQVRQQIAAMNTLAPLHNAVALAVIDWVETWSGQWQRPVSQWACFDTAFHSSLSEAEHTYALPAQWRRLGLRRFGFHGLNHQHLAETVSALLREEGHNDERLGTVRLISAHLGAGCSLCAIAGGRSRATTMGFTPLDGLVMATRSGSVDPGLLLHLLDEHGLSVTDLSAGLHHQSGLLGLSELSGDMRALRQAAAQGHRGASLAIAVFSARLLHGIGAMAAVLRGVDVIALSGGIGENDAELAAMLHSELAWLGPFRLLQIPADEERQIARQCLNAQALSHR